MKNDVEDIHAWKTSFDTRRLEIAHGWNTTYNGRWSLMEEILQWKATLVGEFKRVDECHGESRVLKGVN